MPDGGPRVRASILRGLAPLVRTKGGPDLRDLLASVGISEGALENEFSDISLLAYAQLLDATSKAIGEECLGLQLAEKYPVGGTGILGYLVTNAPDLRQSLVCLTQYTSLQVDSFRLTLDEERDVACLTFKLPDSFLAPRKPIFEFTMAVIVRRIRALYGSNWHPSVAEFEYKAPATCLADYRELFGRCVKFDAGVNRLTLRAETLNRVNHRADPELFKTLQRVAEDQLRTIARSHEGMRGATGRDLLSRLDDYIFASIDSGGAILEKAAEALGLSVHELQLELRRRDTSFAQQLSRIRKGLAERYLRESNLPMSEIADLLGFSELSAFTRAAKGWFNMTPTAYRAGEQSG